MSTTEASIAELARQLSESAAELYEYLGADLDRRVGAALGVQPTQDFSRLFQPRQLTSRAADEGNLSAPSVLRGPQSVPHSSDHFSSGTPTVMGSNIANIVPTVKG